MASLFNRPLAVHEQNSVAGLANRVLAQARRPGARRLSRARSARPTAVIWTGNPVREEIAALRRARRALRGARRARCGCSSSAAAWARRC